MTMQDEERRVPLIEGDDPFSLFEAWYAEALDRETPYPDAMTLGTVDADGLPDLRTVLLKGFDREGFVFFTNTLSAKGRQLEAGKAALNFWWRLLERQVRIRGPVEVVSDAEADAYFATRPRGSQIGAWASDQSRPLPDRAQFIDRIEALERQYEGHDVPRPPHWTGYRLRPLSIEFWQERPFRLHDRLVFTRADASAGGAGHWTKGRIFP